MHRDVATLAYWFRMMCESETRLNRVAFEEADFRGSLKNRILKLLRDVNLSYATICQEIVDRSRNPRTFNFSVSEFKERIIGPLYQKHRYELLADLRNRSKTKDIIIDHIVDEDVKFNCNCKDRAALLVGGCSLTETLHELKVNNSVNTCVGCGIMWNDNVPVEVDEKSEIIESGIAHCFLECPAWDVVRDDFRSNVQNNPALLELMHGSNRVSMNGILVPHAWSVTENQQIDKYCTDFCRRAAVLGVCKNQPTLASFISPEDEGLLNENAEGEVFDIDKIPENLIRARITKYDICSNSFEIDTEQLDLGEFNNRFIYWTQSDIKLNEHLQNGNVKHIVNPLILPKIEEIENGTIFGEGIVGHTVELKIKNRWRKGKISQKLRSERKITLADGRKVNHNDMFRFIHNNQVCLVDLRQHLLDGTLRKSDASHVLTRLRRCLSAQTVPAQAARSMPERV
jgi:hypothetical protein